MEEMLCSMSNDQGRLSSFVPNECITDRFHFRQPCRVILLHTSPPLTSDLQNSIASLLSHMFSHLEYLFAYLLASNTDRI